MKWRSDKYKQKLQEFKDKKVYHYDFIYRYTGGGGKHVAGKVRVTSVDKLYEVIGGIIDASEDTMRSWGKKNNSGPSDPEKALNLAAALGVSIYFLYDDFTPEELDFFSELVTKEEKFEYDLEQMLEKTKDVPGDDAIIEACHQSVVSYFDAIEEYADADIYTYGAVATREYEALCGWVKKPLMNAGDISIIGASNEKIYQYVRGPLSITIPSKLLKWDEFPQVDEWFTAEERKKIEADDTFKTLLSITYDKYIDFIDSL